MKAITTPPEYFEEIEDFPYQPRYVRYGNLKMHYIEEGDGDVVLALHGTPTWSYLYRKFVPVLSQNFRLIAPDFIGFGKSDKLVSWKDYSFDFHLQSLRNFIQQKKLSNINLIVHDWGGILGLSLLGIHPELFKKIVILNTILPAGKPLPYLFKIWKSMAKYHPSLPVGFVLRAGCYHTLSQKTVAAYKAPFPGKRYKGGAKAFPILLPEKPFQQGVAEITKARELLSKWDKPSLILFSDKDPFMTEAKTFFHQLIPSASKHKQVTITGAGHFFAGR